MNIRVQVDKNYTQALLTVTVEPDEQDSASVTPDQLQAALRDANVVFGIDEAALTGICEDRLFNRAITVANYLAPVAGDDARVEILKKPRRGDEIKPVRTGVGDDEEIDYYAPREGFITCVRKGELLAIKHPPKRGEPGKTVLGRTVPGKLGKEIALELFRGQHTEIVDQELHAQREGVVRLHGIQVHVQQVFEINDHIGINTGSIDLPLDVDIEVRVQGDIQRGYSVKCHTLTVTGAVEDATVDVVNLNITGGIVGTSDLPIHADTINVGFINGARHIVARVVKVLREISNGATVWGTTVQTFAIQGSTVVGRDIVWADHVNGDNSITVGVDPVLKAEYETLGKQMREIRGALEELRELGYANARKMKKLQELSKVNPRHPLLLKELPKIKEVTAKLEKLEALNTELDERRKVCGDTMYAESDVFLLVRAGFGKDQSSGMTVDPNIQITIRKHTQKIAGPGRGSLFFLTERGVSSTSRYNIKELKGQLDHLLNPPPPPTADGDAPPAGAENGQVASESASPATKTPPRKPAADPGKKPARRAH